MSIEFALRLIGMMVFALLGVLLGIDLSDALYLPPEATGLTFSLMGALAGLIITPWITTYPARTARRIITQMPAENLFASMVGLLIGMTVSALLALPLSLLPNLLGQLLPTIAAIVITYMSMMVFALRAQDIFALFGGVWQGTPTRRVRGKAAHFSPSSEILLDTSVIIDGRILDISQTGFLQGALIIPRFVLNELQHVADSGEMLRRNRGKRGLEILSELQQLSHSPVRIIDDDIDGIDEVDEKLVLLSQQRNAPVMTNDFNLNRVAEIQGVTVLNINELANALKAIFLPGEVIDIHIVMEGREANQGVGYLEDGTMVVVEDAKRYMDRTIPVLITRYIVTNAGRMYFAQPVESSLRK
ncbi:MAG: PIN domain nuclease [Chloroflexi bacterium]|nr:PIN domain nuclease [Chloroflexota bacterium]